MTEEVFRIVVTVGVVLASIAFVVQAAVVLALYRVSRKMQEKALPLMERVEPVMGKMEPLLDQAVVLFQKASPLFEKAGPVIDQVGQKIGPIADKTSSLIANVNSTVVKTNEILTNTNRIVQDTRPRIAEAAEQAVAIIKSGREQVERVAGVVNDASDRIHTRLEQIDHSVESTVGQVEQAGDNVKRAVMRPVREVNGVAAGISAAISTLLRGRKYHVDAARQDEEMFI